MNEVKLQLENLAGASLDPVIIDELQKEADKTCETVSGFLDGIKNKAEEYVDVLNDVSVELEEFVMDEPTQRLIHKLDEVIDWLYDLQKD